jgi:predicted MFS family arabinose efflux permease
MAAGACFAAGLMSFELISFHLARREEISAQWIPAMLAVSTAGGILASLLLGKLFDRIGMPAVLIGVALSAAFSPLVFSSGRVVILAGLMLWGVGYATQDTLFKALIAGELPRYKRNLAFGLFYAGYGAGWLVGSLATAVLYERSHVALIAFSMSAQLLALPIFVLAARSAKAP